jgi:hypothetical protein
MLVMRTLFQGITLEIIFMNSDTMLVIVGAIMFVTGISVGIILDNLSSKS